MENQEKKITDLLEFFQKIEKKYAQYEEIGLPRRRIKHGDMLRYIHKLERDNRFKVTTIGNSAEGREIYQLKIGTGKIKVLIWSQMHGDESTGTRALFDLFNFLHYAAQFEAEKAQIFNELTLFVVPMLNPDGAERFTRQNAYGIDLNRDAVLLQSPEAKLLKHLRDKIMPDFAFNLHDQDRHFRAGNNKKPAVMSFLAAATDDQNTINPIRKGAMQVIASINSILQHFAPDQVGRYSDSFDARCFGDTFQRSGTRTVLFEAGNAISDPEKVVVRKMNFLAILAGLMSIAGGYHEQEEVVDYQSIPSNRKDLYDLIIRNALLHIDGHEVKVDIGIVRDEKNIVGKEGAYSSFVSEIKEVGDLTGYYAYQEYNADGLLATRGEVFPKVYRDILALSDLSPDIYRKILDMGITTVKLRHIPSGRDYSQLPLHLVPAWEHADNTIRAGSVPNFLIHNHSGRCTAAVVNGFLLFIR